MPQTNPLAVARRLLQARSEGRPVPLGECDLPDAAAAYEAQEATLAELGASRAWKVGARGPGGEPNAAPLPQRGVLPSGAVLTGPQWQLRGIEVEVAVRLGRDLEPADAGDRQRVLGAIDAMLPAIEVVETRLADRRGSSPSLQLADLQSHGALVLGTPVPWPDGGPDLPSLGARVWFDGQIAADIRGGHPVGDLFPLLSWLAVHAAARGRPLRAGDVVTTGTLTGLPLAPAGARVEGEVDGLGRVTLQF